MHVPLGLKASDVPRDENNPAKEGWVTLHQLTSSCIRYPYIGRPFYTHIGRTAGKDRDRLLKLLFNPGLFI